MANFAELRKIYLELVEQRAQNVALLESIVRGLESEVGRAAASPRGRIVFARAPDQGQTVRGRLDVVFVAEDGAVSDTFTTHFGVTSSDGAPQLVLYTGAWRGKAVAIASADEGARMVLGALVDEVYLRFQLI